MQRLRSPAYTDWMRLKDAIDPVAEDVKTFDDFQFDPKLFNEFRYSFSLDPPFVKNVTSDPGSLLNCIWPCR